MPTNLKRKMPPGNEDTPSKRRSEEREITPDAEHSEAASDSEAAPSSAPPAEAEQPVEDSAGKKAHDLKERFKALKARQSQSRTQNRKETAAEAGRLSTDPNLQTALSRKHDIAAHKLLKAEAEENGEDFERKRAWDWTIEESEKWDRRMEKKGKHRDDVAFQDYRQDARKVYKRQIRDLKPDMEAYEKEKNKAVERAAQSGGLEIIETDDGELVAVDKDGTFYSTADSTGFVQNKPDRAAVDRLVADLQKAEEVRLKKRRERAKANGDDGDVTYINDKNKHFNQNLARFYNKYTSEIRDSFERGTAI